MEFPPYPRRSRAWHRVAATLITLVVAAAIGGVVWSLNRDDAAAAGTQPPAGAAASAPAPVAPVPAADSYGDTIARAAPSVVTIVVEQRGVAAAPVSPLLDDPLFREFFGIDPRPAPRGRPRQGLGSGVVVAADGYLVTNHHVVEGADRLQVELSDRRRFVASVVGSDPPTDLALLKIDAPTLPAIAFGDSDRVRVGDVVLALGNPLGIGQTVTLGIISAKDRATGLGDGSFEDFLQTDAAINAGNSGGALVNARGELVGINSQILSPTGGNIGIGFAIPVNMARTVMDALRAGGRVRRGRLGVTIQAMTDERARTLGLDRVTGAIVSAVDPGGPGAAAGLRPGDAITGLNGQRMNDANELRNTIAAAGPGTRVELEIRRDGQTRTLSATLDELPAPPGAGR